MEFGLFTAPLRGARRTTPRLGVGVGGRVRGAAGGERTTRHAPAAPGRLGSIQALDSRRRLPGTGPFAPRRPPHPPAGAGSLVVDLQL